MHSFICQPYLAPCRALADAWQGTASCCSRFGSFEKWPFFCSMVLFSRGSRGQKLPHIWLNRAGFGFPVTPSDKSVYECNKCEHDVKYARMYNALKKTNRISPSLVQGSALLSSSKRWSQKAFECIQRDAVDGSGQRARSGSRWGREYDWDKCMYIYMYIYIYIEREIYI